MQDCCFNCCSRTYSKNESELIRKKFRAFIFNDAKPNPAGLIKVLECFEVKPENALYVGNAKEDIQTGREAGVLHVLIVREEYQEKTDADIKIHSLHELERLL